VAFQFGIALRFLWAENRLKEAVDAAHLVLFKESQAAREELTKKAKEEARKPKLIVPNGNGAIHV
jgi:hypothetical protein